MTDKRAEIISPDHPISALVCVALANACGKILADSELGREPPPEVKPYVGPKSKRMTREHALERMDSLREIMQGAYDLRSVKGEG